jgi:hypothetical protein
MKHLVYRANPYNAAGVEQQSAIGEATGLAYIVCNHDAGKRLIANKLLNR